MSDLDCFSKGAEQGKDILNEKLNYLTEEGYSIVVEKTITQAKNIITRRYTRQSSSSSRPREHRPRSSPASSASPRRLSPSPTAPAAAAPGSRAARSARHGGRGGASDPRPAASLLPPCRRIADAATGRDAGRACTTGWRAAGRRCRCWKLSWLMAAGLRDR